MRVSKKRWFRWAAIPFAAQLALFAYIRFFMLGAPHWAEIPYEPFQDLFIPILGALGLVLGVVVGTLVYSGAIGFILAWIFRRPTS
jgi:hypothetical protein